MCNAFLAISYLFSGIFRLKWKLSTCFKMWNTSILTLEICFINVQILFNMFLFLLILSHFFTICILVLFISVIYAFHFRQFLSSLLLFLYTLCKLLCTLAILDKAAWEQDFYCGVVMWRHKTARAPASVVIIRLLKVCFWSI